MALIVGAFVTAAPANAQMEMEPYEGSPEFEQLKKLIESWEMEMPMKEDGGGAEHEDMPPMPKMTVEYRLTAGGSAIQETMMAGTPMEMVTMYHDRSGSLSLTHYCAAGNQPRLDLTESSPGQMSFDFAQENDLDPAKGMHMHSLHLTIVDADNITQRWTRYMEGVAQPAQDMPFTRVQ
jgi:hypothetical protein